MPLQKMKEAREEANFILDRKPQDDEHRCCWSRPCGYSQKSRGCVCVCRNWRKLMTRVIPSGAGTLAFRETGFKTAEADFKRALTLDPNRSKRGKHWEPFMPRKMI